MNFNPHYLTTSRQVSKLFTYSIFTCDDSTGEPVKNYCLSKETVTKSQETELKGKIRGGTLCLWCGSQRLR